MSKFREVDEIQKFIKDSTEFVREPCLAGEAKCVVCGKAIKPGEFFVWVEQRPSEDGRGASTFAHSKCIDEIKRGESDGR